jgi:Tfp pilus assembly pilus retraction ATPase PilT
MSLMPSLCAALERAGGERLVMRAGERPHVLAGERRHDVASAVLSVNAVEALAEQILSGDGRYELRERGAVTEMIQTPSFPYPLMAKAERVGDEFSIELVVQKPAPAPSEPEPIVVEQAAVETLPVEPAPVESVSYEPAPVEPAPVEPAAVEPEPVAAVPPPVVEHYYSEPTPIESPRASMHIEPVSHPPVTVVTRVEDHRPVHTMRTLSSPAANERFDLQGWIAAAIARGATTLYLRAGAPASARIDDRIQQLSEDIVDAAVLDEASGAFARSGDGVWQSRSDGEWVRDFSDLGNVSCRMFSDHHGFGLVLQLRPHSSPRMFHKHIPRQVRAACEGEGLIVVSAPTETAVESLAVALADWSGRHRGGYLISLQRRSLRGELSGAFVSLRTITGPDAEFAAAIRRASHEGPDILLVTGPQTELPLHEAILASTGGRLVIVAVVAPTTVDALRILVGQSGLDRDAHLRRALAASFRAAVGYRSLRRIGGGRMQIQDIILGSNEIRPRLEAADFDGLANSQSQGAAGMRSVDEALARAIRRGQVSLREAAAHAVDRRHMIALVRMLARTRLPGKTSSERQIHMPIAVDHDRRMDRVAGARRW